MGKPTFWKLTSCKGWWAKGEGPHWAIKGISGKLSRFHTINISTKWVPTPNLSCPFQMQNLVWARRWLSILSSLPHLQYLTFIRCFLLCKAHSLQFFLKPPSKMGAMKHIYLQMRTLNPTAFKNSFAHELGQKAEKAGLKCGLLSSYFSFGTPDLLPHGRNV